MCVCHKFSLMLILLVFHRHIILNRDRMCGYDVSICYSTSKYVFLCATVCVFVCGLKNFLCWLHANETANYLVAK